MPAKKTASYRVSLHVCGNTRDQRQGAGTRGTRGSGAWGRNAGNTRERGHGAGTRGHWARCPHAHLAGVDDFVKDGPVHQVQTRAVVKGRGRVWVEADLCGAAEASSVEHRLRRVLAHTCDGGDAENK